MEKREGFSLAFGGCLLAWQPTAFGFAPAKPAPLPAIPAFVCSTLKIAHTKPVRQHTNAAVARANAAPLCAKPAVVCSGAANAHTKPDAPPAKPANLHTKAAVGHRKLN